MYKYQYGSFYAGWGNTHTLPIEYFLCEHALTTLACRNHYNRPLYKDVLEFVKARCELF